MTMMRKTLLLFLITGLWLLATPGPSLKAGENELPDVNGQWHLTITTRRGPMKGVAFVKQNGEHITVTIPTPQGDRTGKGKVKKDGKVYWVVKQRTARGILMIRYEGKLDGSHTIKGQVRMGAMGAAPFTAIHNVKSDDASEKSDDDASSDDESWVRPITRID